MNEIKHIHLGRTSFTISVEAYKELHEYLEAIKRETGDGGQDVVDEVEARMAELLTEHGLTGEKVLLPSDVAFLKGQLGEPHEFKEDEPTAKHTSTRDEAPKRLYRDTERGMIAGIAAGLAEYVGVDVTLVRILFVVLAFAGGSGFIVYIILWLIVPEAKTNSERLQMRGKAVTVDSLREVVARADVSGAAQRAGTAAGRVLEEIAKLFLGVVGIILTFVGSVTLLATLTSAVYLLTGHGTLNGEKFLPIGTSETWMVVTAAASVAILFLMLILVGIAMVRRKWQIPGWGVAALFGLFFVTAPIAGALIAGSIPNIHHRFEALHKTQTATVAAFKNVDLTGNDTRFSYVPDSKYFLEYRFIGASDSISDIRTSVQGDTLRVDTDKFMSQHTCDGLCIYSGPDLRVIIHAPELDSVSVHGNDANFMSEKALHQSAMSLTVDGDSIADVDYIDPVKTVLSANGGGTRHADFTLGTSAQPFDGVSLDDEGEVSISHTDELDFTTDRVCDEGDPYVFLQSDPSKLTVNGKEVAVSANGFDSQHKDDANTVLNCLDIRPDGWSKPGAPAVPAVKRPPAAPQKG